MSGRRLGGGSGDEREQQKEQQKFTVFIRTPLLRDAVEMEVEDPDATTVGQLRGQYLPLLRERLREARSPTAQPDAEAEVFCRLIGRGRLLNTRHTVRQAGIASGDHIHAIVTDREHDDDGAAAERGARRNLLFQGVGFLREQIQQLNELREAAQQRATDTTAPAAAVAAGEGAAATAPRAERLLPAPAAPTAAQMPVGPWWHGVVALLIGMVLSVGTLPMFSLGFGMSLSFRMGLMLGVLVNLMWCLLTGNASTVPYSVTSE